MQRYSLLKKDIAPHLKDNETLLHWFLIPLFTWLVLQIFNSPFPSHLIHDQGCLLLQGPLKRLRYLCSIIILVGVYQNWLRTKRFFSCVSRDRTRMMTAGNMVLFENRDGYILNRIYIRYSTFNSECWFKNNHKNILDIFADLDLQTGSCHIDTFTAVYYVMTPVRLNLLHIQYPLAVMASLLQRMFSSRRSNSFVWNWSILS